MRSTFARRRLSRLPQAERNVQVVRPSIKRADEREGCRLRRVAGRAGPQDVDRYVGARFRERRILLGLTQQMAELTGVTFQQAHKYEKGINCVAAGSVSV
jgi:hypothetical protein